MNITDEMVEAAMRWLYANDYEAWTLMGADSMRAALEAALGTARDEPRCFSCGGWVKLNEGGVCKACHFENAAPDAQAEPVAWYYPTIGIRWGKLPPDREYKWMPLYTHPPTRTRRAARGGEDGAGGA